MSTPKATSITIYYLHLTPKLLFVLSLTCLNFLLIVTGYAALQFKALNLPGNLEIFFLAVFCIC